MNQIPRHGNLIGRPRHYQAPVRLKRKSSLTPRKCTGVRNASGQGKPHASVVKVQSMLDVVAAIRQEKSTVARAMELAQRRGPGRYKAFVHAAVALLTLS